MMKDGLPVFKSPPTSEQPLNDILFWKNFKSYDEVVIQWEGSRSKIVKLATLLQNDEINVAVWRGSGMICCYMNS